MSFILYAGNKSHVEENCQVFLNFPISLRLGIIEADEICGFLYQIKIQEVKDEEKSIVLAWKFYLPREIQNNFELKNKNYGNSKKLKKFYIF